MINMDSLNLGNRKYISSLLLFSRSHRAKHITPETTHTNCFPEPQQQQQRPIPTIPNKPPTIRGPPIATRSSESILSQNPYYSGPPPVAYNTSYSAPASPSATYNPSYNQPQYTRSSFDGGLPRYVFDYSRYITFLFLW